MVERVMVHLKTQEADLGSPLLQVKALILLVQCSQFYDYLIAEIGLSGIGVSWLE